MTILSLALILSQATVAQFTCPAFAAGDASVVIAGTLTVERRANHDRFHVTLDTDERSRPYDLHTSVEVPDAQAGRPLAFIRLAKDSDPHWISFRLTAPHWAEGLAITPLHIRVSGDDPSGGTRELLSANCTFANSGTVE